MDSAFTPHEPRIRADPREPCRYSDGFQGS